MTNTSDRSMQIVEEIDFILGHFSNPIFPRKIMTAITKGQIEVFDKQTILIHFERAGYKDSFFLQTIHTNNLPKLFIHMDKEWRRLN